MENRLGMMERGGEESEARRSFVEFDGKSDTFGKKFGLDKMLNLCYDNKKIKIRRRERKTFWKQRIPLNHDL